MDFAKYLSDDTKLLIAKQCNDRKKKQFIDLSKDSFYDNNTEYYHYKNDILKLRYCHGETVLSPYLHKLVYGESISLIDRELTQSVIQHLYIMFGPAGGLNSNDYRHIPIQFRRHFWNIVKNFPIPKTPDDGDNFCTYLKNTYNITGGLQDVLLFYYMNNVEELQKDANW